MGGHGALTIYLSSLVGSGDSPKYRSASAFAPILNPSKAPWGEKAFNGYLEGGIDEGSKRYDATELIKAVGKDVTIHVLVDYVCIFVFCRPLG
jgi:S-formylglutathione hydrolase